MRPVILTVVAGVALVVACTGDHAGPPVVDVIPEDTAGLDGDDTYEPQDDTDPPVIDTDLPKTYDCDVGDDPGLANACDWSVNEADATYDVATGITLATRVSPPNARGAFNGLGTGNRAILGFDHYNRKALSEIDAITIEVRHVVGPNEPPQVIMPEIGMIVDLACDGDDYAYVSVVWQNYPTPDDLGGGVQRYTVFANQARFTATGGLPSPEAGQPNILPDPDIPNGVDPGSIADLLGAYPDACVRNRDMNEPGLPAGIDTSGFLLTLGRPNNLQKVEWRVTRVAFGGLEHL